MRCCVLPITSSGPKPRTDADRPESPARARADAAAQFEGLLFASALAPLSKAIGVLGDVLTDAVASAVARGAHDDFYHRLEALTASDPHNAGEEPPA